jgi:regulator of protease activity HflC (stomatin/prohibitin superfamily)
MEEKNYKLFKIGVVAFIILIIFLVLNPFVQVDRGERGVVMNWGAVSNNILGEGLHWRLPIQQSIHKMNVQEVKYVTTSASYSKDTQTVDTEVAFNYLLDASKVNIIYQTIGDNKTVEAVIIDPAIQETQKQVFARYTAQDLLDKRAEINNEINKDLVNRLQDKGIILKSFSILNFDFSDAYEQAVEQKQVAAQDALKAENKLKQVQFESEQRLTQARAEAEAIKIQADAITSQGGAEYVNLKKIEKWNGMGCTSYCGLEASTGLLITGK